jgi:hypothetical protein
MCLFIPLPEKKTWTCDIDTQASRISITSVSVETVQDNDIAEVCVRSQLPTSTNRIVITILIALAVSLL